MRWSKTLIPTLRQVPAEAVVPSHQLMLRAGYIQQVAAGAYSYLPLGCRVLHKVMTIIREEMNRADAVEVLLPALQPLDWWEKTGRRAAYGENLFVLKDRHGREQALGPTHEEVITQLVGSFVESYRQLPLTLYQIQTKFRDEFRPRFGVLRSREFQMKDAYSFDLDIDGLNASYDKMFAAYCRIFKRCGLPYVTVEAESGPIGGSASHEFMVPSPTGEDTILSSDKGNYAANVEKCEIGQRPVPARFESFVVRHKTPLPQGGERTGEGADPANTNRIPSPQPSPLKGDGADAPTGDLEKIHTPNCPGIEDVCAFFKKELGTKLKPTNMLKTLVFQASTISQQHQGAHTVAVKQSGPTYPQNITGDAIFILAIVRGDHEVNVGKLREIVKVTWLPNLGSLELVEPTVANNLGFAIGYVGPQKMAGQQSQDSANRMVIDPDAAQGGFWVTGANEVDHHVKHFNWHRDVFTSLDADASNLITIADIRNAIEGDPSPKDDGGILRESKGIEIGHVFKLGTKYTQALNVTVLDEKQQARPVIMGCYGIGVNRILAGAIESPGGHDDNGIIWPMHLAPYHVVITPIKYEGQVAETADQLYDQLTAHGIEVLLDDRDERPGVKFKDADLIGIPLRIVIGDKGLASGDVEFKRRTAEQVENIPLDRVVEHTQAAIVTHS